MVGPSQQKGKTILWNFCQIGFQRFPNQSNAQISCKKKKCQRRATFDSRCI